MANMSYCRFENTSSDLQDCVDAIEENGLSDLSDTEQRKAQQMREQCETYIQLYDEAEENMEEEGEIEGCPYCESTNPNDHCTDIESETCDNL